MWYRMLVLAPIAAVALVGAAACGDDDDDRDGGAVPTATAAASPAARSTLDILTEAIREEYKARATYQAAIARFGDNTPFANVAQSEDEHVNAWRREFERLGLAVPEDTFSGKVAVAEAPGSLRSGVAAEKGGRRPVRPPNWRRPTPALIAIMRQQQRTVSLENHLVAFERCD
jgi:hypothetical protein